MFVATAVFVAWRRSSSTPEHSAEGDTHNGGYRKYNACFIARADAAEAEPNHRQIYRMTLPSIEDFTFGARLGRHTQRRLYGPAHYGVNSAVFSASFNPPSAPDASTAYVRSVQSRLYDFVCCDLCRRIGPDNATYHENPVFAPNQGTVAIKVIYNVHNERANNLLVVFKPEFHFIETLDHPNVLRGLGHFIAVASRETLGDDWNADPEYVRAETLFVVMEEMETQLQRLISQRCDEDPRTRSAWPPVLSVGEYLVILQRLLRAICHLLEEGIVHRDIKPDNVFLCGFQDHDSDLLIKLADFGCALQFNPDKHFREDFINSNLPRGGANHYLAPEIMTAEPGNIQNPGSLDYSKNDVFALGMVAHYMLCNGAENHEVFSAEHPDYTVDTYNEPDVACPDEIANLVRHMVHPDSASRCTAQEALNQVDALILTTTLSWGVGQAIPEAVHAEQAIVETETNV